jgi:DNA polymerase (family X)
MGRPSNHEIASFLQHYGQLLTIDDERGFRARAVQRAAEVVASCPESVADLAINGKAKEIEHVGTGIAAVIEEFVTTGRAAAVDDTKRRVPDSVLAILGIPGLGPKTVRRLFLDLNVGDIDGLRWALRQGKINQAAGFNARTVTAIENGLVWLSGQTGRFLIGDALPRGRRLLQSLREELPGVQIELTGSIRRLEETVGNINFIAAAEDIAALERELTSLSPIPLAPDGSLGQLTGTFDSLPVAVKLVSPNAFGTRWIESTSRPDHLELVATLTDRATEEEAYQSAGLPWIPPELRTGQDEIEWAKNGTLSELVQLADIRGDLHSHSTWSDGKLTVAEMAEAARGRGYSFLGVTDHSKGLGVANGLTVDRLNAQRQEIDAINARSGITLLAGSEVEVMRDGELDFPDDVLKSLQVVVASTHSGLRQPREQLTDRLIRVLRNPHVDIIAHPSGRLIERRPPGDFDWSLVYEAAAATKTGLEINCDPARLDLSESAAREALQAGCMLTMNCDAHSEAGFDNLQYGLALARRAGATPADMINCFEIDALLQWLSDRSNHRS